MFVRDTARAVKYEVEVALRVFESVDSPRSLACYLLTKYGEFHQLLSKSYSPVEYNDAEQFADDYLCISLLTKSKVLDAGIDRRQVALDAFHDAESLCKRTNERLSSIFYENSSPDDLVTLVRISHEIEQIMGRTVCRYDLSRIERGFSFGPGSTFDIKAVVTKGRKFGGHKLSTTPKLASYGLHALPSLWREGVTTLDVVQGNRWMSVPKNWKTDRGICAEPTLNIYVQKGIGAYIREKLRFVGVDLNDQTHNQKLAKQGSEDDSLATIDLSMASDTLAWSVVRFLVPEKLFQLLDCARSSHTLLPDGSWVELEKFSSMGNGYTFELESLIFTAVVRSVVPEKLRHLCSVYGDDIIVPKEFFSETVRVLNLLGFKTNVLKSFGEGYFRESCGADFFHGKNVRPFFLRTDHLDMVETAYITANLISDYAEKRNNSLGRDGRFLPAYLRAIRPLSKKDLLPVPKGYESNGLVGFDRTRRNVPQAFRYRKIPTQKKVISDRGVLLAYLSGDSTFFSKGKESLRGRRLSATYKVGHTLVWPLYQEWYA